MFYWHYLPLGCSIVLGLHAADTFLSLADSHSFYANFPLCNYC